ncbi:MAG: MGMT family protein [Candidatus Woesearchaeota archaeon]
MVSFSERVLSYAMQIPRGRVSTYQDIAHKLGCRAYQAVGSALRSNKNPIVVPCYRVVHANGFVGMYLGSSKQIKIKVALLQKEGVCFDEKNNVINFDKVRYTFGSNPNTN